nr:hypothetical protein [Tanacetum cinerariifolium]
MQTQESKIDKGRAVDADLVITKNSGTELEVQDDNSRSWSDTYADDADIRPIYDEEPMAEFFAIAALKNELRKLNGNSVDTKFAKTSVLGKPVSQSLINQSFVRQPHAFEFERPPMSKPRFASKVDVNNNLPRPVTQHYLPKRRESAFAKPDHMIASSKFRNSSKNMPRFSSNEMVHDHYIDNARKKTQERDRKSKNSVIPNARFQSTADGSKPKHRSTNHSTRSSSCVTIVVVPIEDHSKNSNSFSNSKHFVCFTCHKCVFNANHDACITAFLKKVNYCATIQSNKTRNNNKLVEQKIHTQKPNRQIFKGHRFSPNKTSAVYEKTSPRSDLRWKPTGRIFKIVGLRWVPTRKILASCTSKDDSEPTHGSNVEPTGRIFENVGLRWIPTGKLLDSCTSKVDSEPPNGSNIDITNPHECKQTLDSSACTSINVPKEPTLHLSAALLVQEVNIVTVETQLRPTVLKILPVGFHLRSDLGDVFSYTTETYWEKTYILQTPRCLIVAFRFWFPTISSVL